MRLNERWASMRSGKIAAGILCAVLVIWLGGKAHRRISNDARNHQSDYEAFLIGGRALLQGEDMYVVRTTGSIRRFTLPAWGAMCMVPFALMGYRASSFVWPVLNLVVLAASSYWCLRVVRGRDKPVPWPVWVVPPLLLLRALDSNSGLGQINIFILGLVSGGLYLYVRKRDFWAGVALAAATLTKPMPGLFLAYFVWKREWRVVRGGVLGILLLTLVVPIPLLGVTGGYRNVRDWLDKSILHYATDVRDDGYVAGQSLRTMVYRFLTDSQAAAYTREVVHVNVASLSPEAAEAIYKALTLLLLGVLGVACFGRADRRNVPRTAAELSLVAAAMLVVTPFNRKAHFVLLMLPMTYAYSRLVLAEAWSRRDRVLFGAAAACFALTVMTADAYGKGFSMYVTALSCMAWGTLALMVGLLVVLRGIRKGEDGASFEGALDDVMM